MKHNTHGKSTNAAFFGTAGHFSRRTRERHVIAPNLKNPLPSSHPTVSERHNRHHLDIELHLAATPLSIDSIHHLTVHERVHHRIAGFHRGDLPRPLGERRDPRISQRIILMENRRQDVHVGQREFLVGIGDLELGVPRGAHALVGSVEVGDRERLQREIGEVRSHD